ncbi:hypothetical protein UFOVP49_105 [uncultured Caudovirales phage]|uniref:Uncharacterized protein n=1 Tax=uncultured Caudovirales phage TaxID=2100421 RepID=A0A6J5KTP1_9CAUD|nr:hypothetical protein UFOVP49_105 [uncultured Caudovirales phage]
MSTDAYTRISCPNCESQYAVDYMLDNVDGTPDHCPFCGDEIPDDTYEDKSEEEGESEEGQW